MAYDGASIGRFEKLDIGWTFGTYVNKDICDAEFVWLSSIFTITVRAGGLNIANVYKPPNIPWHTNVLPRFPHRWICAEDFIVFGDTFLTDASKTDKGSFHSARWNGDYNPDLCFISQSDDIFTPAELRVLISQTSNTVQSLSMLGLRSP